MGEAGPDQEAGEEAGAPVRLWGGGGQEVRLMGVRMGAGKRDQHLGWVAGDKGCFRTSGQGGLPKKWHEN